MGNYTARHFTNPEGTPVPDAKATFDPMLGFPDERQPREMVATLEEMQSAKIPLELRDYCVHKLIDYQGCKKRNFPWVVKCHPEKHAYLTCEYEDYVLRMKEYEREKRLLHRRQRQEA